MAKSKEKGAKKAPDRINHKSFLDTATKILAPAKTLVDIISEIRKWGP